MSVLAAKCAGDTRFATNFIMLERLLEVRQALEELVVSVPWKEWAKDAKYAAGASVCKASVNDDTLFDTLGQLHELGK